MTGFIEGVPSFQKFRHDVLPIHSDGDLEQAYNALLIALHSGKTSIHGDTLTWSYILKQFDAHIKWWNKQFKKSEASGYPKETHRAKRLDIQTFIEKEAWNKDYVFHEGSLERDQYLFGSLPADNLKEQLHAFKKTFRTS